MTFSIIEDQLVAALAATATLGPIRWPNENWPVGMMLSPDNSPLDVDGNPIPFIQAEVIGGRDSPAIGPPGTGQVWSERLGLWRIYLVAPLGSGRAKVNAEADNLCRAFKRDTVFVDNISGERLTLMDPSVDDNVAERTADLDVRIDETVPLASHAARWVRMISIPWRYEYYF